MERKTHLVYPWSVSATRWWGPSTGIECLRDETAEQLAEWFNAEPDFVAINSALVEISAHGNPRKSAELARLIVKEHPELEEKLKDEWGEELSNYLLKLDLKQIPGNPSEYPEDVKIEYLQKLRGKKFNGLTYDLVSVILPSYDPD